MKLIDKLEKKIGRFAIRNLMLYLVILFAIGFVIQQTNYTFYYLHLSLDASKILKGEVWRLVTYLCYPPSTNVFLCFISCYFYYILGRFFERIQGTFRFNLYVLTGIIGQILASILIYLILDDVYLLTPGYIYTTMFLAIALTFPEMSFYLYMVIPVKAKWLAGLYGVFIGYQVVTGTWGDRIGIIMSLINFIIYFFVIKNPINQAKQQKRRSDFERATRQDRRGAYGFGAGRESETPHEASGGGFGARQTAYRHKCAVCGITDLDAPNMEFRYCTKCDGNREYCMDHLYTHVHVHEGDSKES